jgi:hypothetical protein
MFALGALLTMAVGVLVVAVAAVVIGLANDYRF